MFVPGKFLLRSVADGFLPDALRPFYFTARGSSSKAAARLTQRFFVSNLPFISRFVISTFYSVVLSRVVFSGVPPCPVGSLAPGTSASRFDVEDGHRMRARCFPLSGRPSNACGKRKINLDINETTF
ncbi:hypothetical protein CRV029 [Nile crocodilepox virus]|uniref:Uncharacterized protein n=1 Tax=Nile crocodilepox virus (isolate Crocodylus niloticus/Zimbabwe/Ume/2001) TaxID=1289473 RepID=Q070M2_CPRVZ|nr:hypothetical protein CRV029 [Nile crocodilepox virus]ABJ08920.1 hypothetical protein CRV029 [Nile crocodilepox virus]